MLDNIQAMRGIRIVMGFSPGLARPSAFSPIQFIESHMAHAAVNKVMLSPGDTPPEEIRAFMSVYEVRELLEIDGVEIAMHGCMHLKLEAIANRTSRLLAFKQDIEDGTALFN